MPAPLNTPAVLIPTGASGLSAIVYIGMAEIIGYTIGTHWQAGDISLQGSADGVNFYEVLKSADATAVALKAAATGYYTLATPLRIGPWIKIRSGPSGSPVNQTDGDATVTLILRALSGMGNQ